MELIESRRGLRSLKEEAVAGDRGVLGGFVGSMSSFVFPTNAAVVNLLKRRGGVLPAVSRMGASPGVLRWSRQPYDVECRRTGIHGSTVGAAALREVGLVESLATSRTCYVSSWSYMLEQAGGTKIGRSWKI